ncbi:adenylate/guanylate cyclase domain-containing protein [Actinophytocola sediminis]
MTEPDVEALQQRIEHILLGGARQYTRAEVAERSGVPVDRALDLWRALGFATVGDDATVFTDGDISALRIANGLIQAGVVGPAAALSTTRMLGQHMSRLAESQVLLLRDLLTAHPELTDERQLAQLVEHITPAMEQLLNFVWRRHLAAYSVRMLVAPDEDLDERRQVVGFADMVGFTSLTRRSTEAELETVIEHFEAIVAEVVAENHGRIVKLLGDEVLFVADSPADGAEIALTLVERAEAAADVPPLRAGLALGRVLSRYGDIFGSVVNIASRLTSIARPGTVLIDRELSEVLTDEPAFVVRQRRPTAVRGYARLRSASLRRAGEEPPTVAESAQRIAAEFLGLLGDEEPHVPLRPDDEPRARRRRR